MNVLLSLLCAFLSLSAAASAAADSAASAGSAECVILLHGLARSSSSLDELAEELSAAGYAVVNFDYPSRHYSVEELARNYLPVAVTGCADYTRISFVTHSLGGILLRFYLSENELPQLGRVVMLAPPSQGSEVVDKLKNVPGFNALNGPAGQQLGTGSTDMPNSLPPVDYAVGVIAGSRSINLLLSLLIPGDDDGKVSIERAKLAGMTDFIVLPHTHPLMMGSNEVIAQVLWFLRNGHFEH